MKFIAGYDFLSGFFTLFAIFRGGKTGFFLKNGVKTEKIS
jgi:hypothetical protein